MSSTTTPTLSPDHNNSALLTSGVINLILFLVILYLLSFVFKRSGRWRRQQRQADSERLPLLNIATIANSSEQQQPQQGPLLGEQQQQPPSNQQQQQPPLNQQQQQDPVNPQGQEHNDHDDLESIDLLSTSSNQRDPVQPNWFRQMFKKK